MALRQQAAEHMLTDKTGSAGEEDFHAAILQRFLRCCIHQGTRIKPPNRARREWGPFREFARRIADDKNHGGRDAALPRLTPPSNHKAQTWACPRFLISIPPHTSPVLVWVVTSVY